MHRKNVVISATAVVNKKFFTTEHRDFFGVLWGETSYLQVVIIRSLFFKIYGILRMTF